MTVTGLEILLAILLVAIVVGILYLRLGCEKPRPGKRQEK